MATRRSPAPASAASGAQQIFKPRETVVKFAKIFPILYGVFGLVFVAALAVAYYFKLYVMPVMVAFPVVGAIAGGVFTNRIASSRVVIDAERIRLVRGQLVEANLPWHTITRLTIRQERGDNLYEMWVKEKAVPLPASFYVDGDKLLMAVSARTSLAWEKL